MGTGLEIIIIVGVAAYIMVGIGFSEAQDDRALFILWPLCLVKELLKGLYRVLFTGWGD